MNRTTPTSVLCVVALLTTAGAQAQLRLPPGATAGAAFPRLAAGDLRERPDSEMTVPAVIDRPVGMDEGPRVLVRTFEIRVDGPPAAAWRDGDFVDDLRAMFEARRRSQPPEGFTIGQLERIARDATDLLRDKGLLVGQVYLPVQTVEGGTVVVQVMQGRLGTVSPEGNNLYSGQRLTRPFTPLKGLPVDRDEIDWALREINEYPGLVATGVFAPGDKIGTTALNLRVRSEKKYDYAFGVDNYGTSFTGEYRAYFRGRANNVTGHADWLDFNILGTGDPANSIFGGLNYSNPMFGVGRNLTLSVQTNEFDVGRELAAQEITGTTDIYTIGYEHVLMRGSNLNATVLAGLSRKTAELQRSGAPFGLDELAVGNVGIVFDSKDRAGGLGLNQGVLIYSHGFDDFLGSMDTNGDGRSSRVVPPNLRAGGDFDKWYMNYTRLQRFTDNLTFLVRLEAQQSDDLLVSLEQFSLGGPNSVRAYSPSEFLVDSGGFISTELIVAAPGFATRPAFNNRSWGEVLQFSFFYDYAGGYLSDAAVVFGEQKTQDLHGGGIGVRVSPTQYFSARLEAAWRGTKIDAVNGREPQIYFSFNFTF